MPRRSAGILLYRRTGTALEVFLAHPGGPFWATKDLGAWTVPKGEIDEGEDPKLAAQRELLEETGCAPRSELVSLGSVQQKSGKEVLAWAAEGDCDPAQLKSNLCTIEWPPRSGRKLEIPEIDRAAWFEIGEARSRILPAQAVFLTRLTQKLNG